MSLIRELKRRNVFRVGIAYLLVGWVVMQVGEVMASALQLPSWVLSTLAFFLILGFPLALIFAWAFELTPEGIKFERNVESSHSGTTATGRKLEFVIFGVLVIAVGFLLYDRADKPHQDTDRVTSERAGNELSDSGPHSPPAPADGRITSRHKNQPLERVGGPARHPRRLDEAQTHILGRSPLKRHAHAAPQDH